MKQCYYHCQFPFVHLVQLLDKQKFLVSTPSHHERCQVFMVTAVLDFFSMCSTLCASAYFCRLRSAWITCSTLLLLLKILHFCRPCQASFLAVMSLCTMFSFSWLRSFCFFSSFLGGWNLRARQRLSHSLPMFTATTLHTSINRSTTTNRKLIMHTNQFHKTWTTPQKLICKICILRSCSPILKLLPSLRILRSGRVNLKIFQIGRLGLTQPSLSMPRVDYVCTSCYLTQLVIQVYVLVINMHSYSDNYYNEG